MPADGEAGLCQVQEQPSVSPVSEGNSPAGPRSISDSGASSGHLSTDPDDDSSAGAQELASRVESLQSLLQGKESALKLDRDAVSALQNEVEILKKEVSAAHEEGSAAVRMMAQEYAHQKAKSAALEQEVESSNRKRRQAEAELQSREGELQAMEQEVREGREETRVLEKRLEEADKEKDMLEKKLAEKDGEISKCEERLEEASNRSKDLQLSLQAEKTSTAALEFSNRLTAAREELLSLKLTELQQRYCEMEKEAGKKEQLLKVKVASLEEGLAAAQAVNSSNQVDLAAAGGRIKILECEAHSWKLLEGSLRSEVEVTVKLLEVERARAAEFQQRWNDERELGYTKAGGASEREVRLVYQGRLEESREREREAWKALREEEVRRGTEEEKLDTAMKELAEKADLLGVGESKLAALTEELWNATEALKDTRERESSKDVELKAVKGQLATLRGDLDLSHHEAQRPQPRDRPAWRELQSLGSSLKSLGALLEDIRQGRFVSDWRMSNVVQAIANAGTKCYDKDTEIFMKMHCFVKEGSQSELRKCLKDVLVLNEKTFWEEHGHLITMLFIVVFPCLVVLAATTLLAALARD